MATGFYNVSVQTVRVYIYKPPKILKNGNATDCTVLSLVATVRS